MLLYPATIKKDAGTFVVLFPDIPHAHTNGSSREDAISHAPDALHTALSMLMEQGRDIPAPGKARKSSVMIGLPSVIAASKVALYSALRCSGMRKAELARRMGIHKQQVERLLDPDHKSRIEQIEAAFRALHMRIDIEIRDAA